MTYTQAIARKIFLDNLEDLNPKILEALYGDLLPLFRSLVRWLPPAKTGGDLRDALESKRVEHRKMLGPGEALVYKVMGHGFAVQWRVRANSQRGPTAYWVWPDIKASRKKAVTRLRSGLLRWSAQFGLQADWLIDVAVETLLFWLFADSAGFRLTRRGFFVHSEGLGFFVAPLEISFNDWTRFVCLVPEESGFGWYLPKAEIENVIKSIVQGWENALRQKVQAHFTEIGYDLQKSTESLKKHCQWLVLFQTMRWTQRQIKDWWRARTGVILTEPGISDGIRNLSKLIGLKLRTQQRGRPHLVIVSRR
jgi:hypothetical protein